MPVIPPTPIIGDTASAASHVGKSVDVRGIARDAKISAAIVTGDLVVYCTELTSWPSTMVGKAVVGHGMLVQTDEFTAKREGDPGTDGPVYVLRPCTVDPQR